MYSLLRPILFHLDAEKAHHLTLYLLKLGHNAHLLPKVERYHAVRQVMNIEFPNPVGLAAGLDKNGQYIDALADLGFGFIEIGTITPRPQPGNPKPRLFRLPEHNAIINRMGFNNDGVDALIANVKNSKFQGVLGINIGKNVDTPVEKAADDYLICFNKVYEYATYIVANISSPNTPGLRTLQFGDTLRDLFEPLKKSQTEKFEQTNKYVPLLVKIAPDMEQEEVEAIANTISELKLDGVIATNTTITRDAVAGHALAEEQGGLSGAPVTDKSTQVIKWLREYLPDGFPIIGVGGIVDAQSAKEKFEAGADLVQVYSGLIYRGPALVKDALRGFKEAK